MPASSLFAADQTPSPPRATTGGPRPRWDNPLAVLLFAAAAFINSIIPLLVPGDRALGDNGGIETPNRLHAARMLRDGHLPFWTDHILAGFPLFADSQTAMLHPSFPLLVLWPTPRCYELTVAINVILCGWGTSWYLSRYCRRRWTAAWGGALHMAFISSIANGTMAGTMAAGLTPLTLRCIDDARAGSRRAPWIAALIQSVNYFAGLPHLTFVSWLTAFLYLGSDLLVDRRRWLKLNLLLFVLPMAIIAVQVWPLYEFFQQSERQPDEVVTGITEQHYLPAPFALAAAAIAALCAAAAARHGTSTTRAAGLTALTWFGLAAAAGTLVTQWLYRLPVFSWFRWPMSYLDIASLALLILAALALDGVSRGWSPSRSFHWSTIGLTAWGLLPLALATLLASYSLSLFYPGFYDRGDPLLIQQAQSVTDFRLLPIDVSGVKLNLGDLTRAQRVKRVWEQQADILRPNFNLIHNVPVLGVHAEHGTVCPRRADQFDSVLQRLPHPLLLRAAAVSHLASQRPLFTHHFLLGDQEWELSGPHPVDQHLAWRRLDSTTVEVSPHPLPTRHPWDLLLRQRHIPVVRGTTYRLQLAVHASPPRDLHLSLNTGHPRYRPLGLQRVVRLDGQPSLHELVFRATESCAAAELQLQLGDSNVPVVLHQARLLHGESPAHPPELSWLRSLETLQESPVAVYRPRQPPQRAWMVYRTHVIADRNQRLHALEHEPFDPHQLALLDEPLTAPLDAATTAAATSAHYRQLAPGHCEVDVDTPAHGLCVIALRHDPHLQATLDGAPVKLWVANHMFCGVAVPPGKHLISVRYRLPSFAPLAALALATTCLVLWRAVTLPGVPATTIDSR